jgi:lantibiotic leader peptide-processing serine protease
MKANPTSLLVLCVLAPLVTVLFGAAPQQTAAGEREGRYVVVFGGSQVLPTVVEKAGGSIVRAFPQVGIAIASSRSPTFAAKLRGKVLAVGREGLWTLPDVEVVAKSVENGPGPLVDDAYYPDQWDIRRVQADAAWNITTGSKDTVVAIIDTGVAWNHPDLAPNVVFAACYSSSAFTCTNYPSLHWHGTHVAGTVAAAFGGGQVVGVGPDLGLASYNVFEPDDGGSVVAYDEALWAAMLDAADQQFDVINMSLGAYIVVPEDGPAAWVAWNRVANYVRNRGVTIVASAGNGGVSLNGKLVQLPGDLPGIISVGATGIRPDPQYPADGAYDVLAFYSNFGAPVALVAPGGDLGPEGIDYPYPAVQYLVLSSYVRLGATEPSWPACVHTATCPTSYAFSGGTSMAAPHVAGAAGLVRDLNPQLRPNRVEAILKQTAYSLGDRQMFGHGMLDVYSALTK